MIDRILGKEEGVGTCVVDQLNVSGAPVRAPESHHTYNLLTLRIVTHVAQHTEGCARSRALQAVQDSDQG